MRNVFLFIRRYFNFIFFLLLQVFCIYLITHYNKYHNAVGSSAMNEITGRINTQYNKIDYYLQLKRTNEQLVKDNERLRNSQRADFENPDTTNKEVTDSIPFDTLGNRRKWLYQRAKVVSNSVTTQNNFVVLGRGTGQQLAKDELENFRVIIDMDEVRKLRDNVVHACKVHRDGACTFWQLCGRLLAFHD